MKCYEHREIDAVAACVFCGKGLCPGCLHTAGGSRVVCSAGCAEGLARGEKALEAILQQTLRSARASAFYCYLCGGLSAAGAVVAWFLLPSPFLILFTAGCAVVLILSGIWYGRAARKAT